MYNKQIVYHQDVRSQISHELRTPLTGIFGAISLLKKTNLTRQQQKYLQLIVGSTNNLLALENKLHVFIKST